jgi:transcriptional regulator with XRE-family HTH domain
VVTPFGVRIRELRALKGVTQKEMAEALGVTAAYLSALEHGKRAAPNWALQQKIVGYFNVIWDEAEDLQRIAEHSHPRVTIDTAGLSAEATLLANRLAASIARLSQDDLAALLHQVDEMERRSRRR